MDALYYEIKRVVGSCATVGIDPTRHYGRPYRNKSGISWDGQGGMPKSIMASAPTLVYNHNCCFNRFFFLSDKQNMAVPRSMTMALALSDPYRPG